MTDVCMSRGQHVYFARVIPGRVYDVYELIIRTIKDDYFVGVEKHDKRAFLFSYSDIGKTVFSERGDALEYVKFRESTYEEVE